MALESTRITLIRCMRKLVREKSFSKIKVEEICASAHISRRTFYRYYKDKYALLKDVYTDSFFKNLDIIPEDTFWNIFDKICEQIYSEKGFFIHAFAVKGQNGFWEELRTILTPYMRREFPSHEFTDNRCNWFIAQDIFVLFLLIEEWIQNDFTTDPASFSKYVRFSFAVHGKWTYQNAMGYPIEVFTPEKMDSNEW